MAPPKYAPVKDSKKSEAKDRLSENRPTGSQGQECSRSRTMDTTGKCSPEKRSSRKKLNIFRKNSDVLRKKKSSQNFREVSGDLQDK